MYILPKYKTTVDLQSLNARYSFSIIETDLNVEIFRNFPLFDKKFLLLSHMLKLMLKCFIFSKM